MWGEDEGGYTSASDSVESGSCFPDVLWTRPNKKRGAELVPRQPGAAQHHGNISYILQVRLICEDEQSDLNSTAYMTQKGCRLYGKLLAKTSVVLSKTPLFHKALLLDKHEWWGWGRPIYTQRWAYSGLSFPHAFLQTSTSHKVVGLSFPCT